MMCLINAKEDLSHADVFYKARYNSKGIANSIDKTIPNIEQHLKWYLNQNLDKMFLIYHDEFVGYIRVSEDGFISIAMCEGKDSMGYGTFALSKIIRKYNGLKAIIRLNNIQSINLFKKFPDITIKYDV